MPNAALSALKWKGMRSFSSPTTAPLLVNGQETACKLHQRDQFAAEISIPVDATGRAAIRRHISVGNENRRAARRALQE